MAVVKNMDPKLMIVRIMLMEKQPVTSKTIASLLSVSSRSVMNYINQINQEKPLIHAVQNGYIAKEDALKRYIRYHEPIDSPENRIQRIMIRLLNNQEPLNFYDLAEEFHISESALANDIKEINHTLSLSNTRVTRQRNLIYVDGSIEDIGALLTNIINRNKGKKMLTLLDVYEGFDDTALIDTVRHAIREVKSHYGIYNNNFIYVEFILHCCTVLHYQGKKETPFQAISDPFSLSAREFFVYRIQELSQMTLSNDSKRFIYSQFDISFYGKSSMTLNSDDSSRIHAAWQRVSQQFNIHIHNFFSNKEFVVHLVDMINRIQTQKEIYCPVTESIKTNHYVLFEIAFLFAKEIEKEFEGTLVLNEHEVALLAIHLGNCINKTPFKKLTAALIVPDRFVMLTKLLDLFEKNFPSDITVSAIHNYTYGYLADEYDLIFSVLGDLDYEETDVYTLDPFDNKKNISIIQDAIDNLERKRSIRYISAVSDSLFENCLFFNNPDQHFNDKFEVIDFLCDALMSRGYIGEVGKKSIIHRERKASTAFGKIAIPHEFSASAKVSKIVILKSQSGIIWDNSLVNVVFLTIVGDHERNEFHHYLTALINSIADDHLDFISSPNVGFEQFLDFLLI